MYRVPTQNRWHFLPTFLPSSWCTLGFLWKTFYRISNGPAGLPRHRAMIRSDDLFKLQVCCSVRADSMVEECARVCECVCVCVSMCVYASVSIRSVSVSIRALVSSQALPSNKSWLHSWRQTGDVSLISSDAQIFKLCTLTQTLNIYFTWWKEQGM